HRAGGGVQKGPGGDAPAHLPGDAVRRLARRRQEADLRRAGQGHPAALSPEPVGQQAGGQAMSARIGWLLFAAAALLLLLEASLYTVSEQEQVIITQF